jgi:hypothetical protein
MLGNPLFWLIATLVAGLVTARAVRGYLRAARLREIEYENAEYGFDDDDGTLTEYLPALADDSGDSLWDEPLPWVVKVWGMDARHLAAHLYESALNGAL